MYLAGYIVTGLRDRGRATRGARCAGAGAATRRPRWRSRSRPPRSPRRCRSSSATGSPATSTDKQPSKLAAIEGLGAHDDAARRSTSSAGTTATTCATASRSRACSRSSPSTTRTRPSRGSTRCRRRTGRRTRPSTSRASRSRRWSGSARRWRLLGVAVRATCASARDACPSRAGSTGRCVARRAGVGGRADRRLGHDRGRPPAVGRLPGDAHLGGGDARRRHPGRLRDARSSSTPRSRSAVWWVLRRLSRTPLGSVEPAPSPCSRPPASPRSRSPMTLDAFPLVLIVAGLTAYGVLGGADFGAGFWSLLGGPADRGGSAARPRAPRDRPGVGGEPRLADLRARRLLDRLPDRVRLDHVDARRPALHRRGRDHPARHGLRPARRHRDARASCAPSTSCSRSRRSSTPFAFGAAIGGDRVGPRAGRQRRRATCRRAGSTGRRSSSACSRSPSPRTSPPSTSPPTRRALATPELAEAFRVRALVMGVVAGAIALGGAARRPPRRARDLGRAHERLGPRRGARVGARGRRDDAARLDAAATARRARRPRPPSRAVLVGWVLAQRPDVLPGLSIHQAAAGRSTLIALVIATAIGAVLLIPSLVILYGLLLGGRVRRRGPGRARGRRARAASAHGRGCCRSRAALFGVGAVLTVFFDAPRDARARHRACCSRFAVCGFLVLSAPVEADRS